MVFLVHKETLLDSPGRKEGEGKEEGEAIGVMLLDVLAVEVVERVEEFSAVGEWRGESVRETLGVIEESPEEDTVSRGDKERVAR